VRSSTFCRAWRETADRRLAGIEDRLGKIESEIGGLARYRKQMHAELTVLRSRQDQQDVFNRGIGSFMVELQATLGRIERKLDGQ
jgi:hypothetical protein